MKQLILNKEPVNNIIHLDGNDYHYLVHVRRLAVGEQFPALLPNGNETLIKITSINNGVLTGECVKPSSSSAPLRLCESNLFLFQALPKGDKMDLIVRQAAEGGIAEVVPFVSEFSIAKTKSDSQKFLRWQRIAKEARQQSGSKIDTKIHSPLSIKELFEYWNKLAETCTIGLLFHHTGVEKNSLHEYLYNVGDPVVALPKVVISIGPEGGFSDTEVSLFTENNFKTFTIGDTVLRTETAALYCAAAVKIILLEKDSWQLKKP